jgi:hypothetical protein
MCGVANQHTSELVGVERAWADAAAIDPNAVRKALAPHMSRPQLRTLMAWLPIGAPYEYASAVSIHNWRKLLVAAGDPPKPRRRIAAQTADNVSSDLTRAA